MVIPLFALCSTIVCKWLPYMMRIASEASCNSALSWSVSISPEWIRKSYLQFDLQVSVDVRTDNNIKKANAGEEVYFFLIVSCCFKRWKKFKVMGRRKPLAWEMGISRLLGRMEKKPDYFKWRSRSYIFPHFLPYQSHLLPVIWCSSYWTILYIIYIMYCYYF